MVALDSDGTFSFSDLSISESSTKHKERHFMLEFTVLRCDGWPLVRRRSAAFYAYSHKKVLQRRGNVKLRDISPRHGSLKGGDLIHVIGFPFIQGPALSVVFHTTLGDVCAGPLEHFSDSVLFFILPRLPLLTDVVPPGLRIEAEVVVTNDGRAFSNPLPFCFFSDPIGSGLFSGM